MSEAKAPEEGFAGLSRRAHLPSLDGLRAVAVGAVMGFHFGVLGFRYGRFGVSLFFVLSGYLITLLLLREFDRTGAISLRKFYLRRAFRIFPAYYAFLILSFGGMVLLDTPPDARLIVVSALYLLNYAIALGVVSGGLVSHGWSLAVEEQFYALWPAVLRALGGQTARSRRVVLVLLAAILCWRVVLWLNEVAGYAYYAFDTRFDALLVGCGLALCASDPWVQTVARWISASALLPLGTIALLLPSLGYSAFWNATVGYSFEALLLAILLVQVVVLHDHPWWRWLNSRPARYLGALSYPLYLYHPLVKALVARFGDWRLSFQFVANVALTLALAAASYHLLEKPFLRIKRRWEVVESGG